MTAPTADSLGLNGVNATVYARLLEQAELDGRGWVCGHILRLPHIGGEAKHSRIAEIRAALRTHLGDADSEPIERAKSSCGLCAEAAKKAKAEGRKPSRVYAYRLSPVLWNTEPLQGALDLEGRRAS